MKNNGHKSTSPTAGLPKCPTGIQGLDEITGGGLPRGRPTLVCGGTGCGKTLLAAEFLVRGAVQFGEPGVFMAFEETEAELKANVASLGFDLAGLIRRKKIAIDYVHIERSEVQESGEYDLEGLFVRLNHAIDSIGARRVVLDTLEALFASLPNEAILRAELRRLFRWLKDKGVGVDRDEWVSITNVKIDGDKVEIHLEGGGEGRRGSNHANKMGASYKRAGGSRLNLKFQKDLTDTDIAPQNILTFMARLLDVSRIEQKLQEKEMAPELRAAIEAHTVQENMTYEMVLMSFGDPDQKKVDESDDTNLRETWFYLKNGHRWVVRFDNGKVVKTQVF